MLGPRGILEVGCHDELIRRGGAYAELAFATSDGVIYAFGGVYLGPIFFAFCPT